MRRLILILSLAVCLLGAATAQAANAPTNLARPGGANAAVEGVGLPLVAAPAAWGNTPPPGFSSTGNQAIRAAEHDPRMIALHHRMHPLDVRAYLWDGASWWINFWRGDTTVAAVDVNRAGRVTGVWQGRLALTVYGRGHYSPLFDSWYVVVPFSVMFLLLFVDLRGWRRMAHLDAVMMLSFLVSYWRFDHAHLTSAVWLAYPPLLYLLGRMAWLGLRRARATAPVSVRLPGRVLLGGLLVLIGARIALSFIYGPVMDVGYASILGAHRILHGQALYFLDPGHGDTYGPITYLAYVPFELLFPWHGRWDYLMAGHVASITFDLLTILALVALGMRLRPAAEGRRLGLALGWAWAACPFTLLGLIQHTNDSLVALLSVLALLVFAQPVARGAMLGLAAAAKFSPAALLPLLASPRDGGWKRSVACVAGFAVVALSAVLLYLPPAGFSLFYHETLGYQLTRPDVFSPWALHPSLAPIKVALEVGAVVFAAALMFLPRRERALPQMCALAAAVTIALQLPALHWFYFYVIWFAPFVFVALFAAPRQPVAFEPPVPGEPERQPELVRPTLDAEPQRVLVGA